MTIALYIAASCAASFALLVAAAAGQVRSEGGRNWPFGFLVAIICTIGAAAMLIAGVKA